MVTMRSLALASTCAALLWTGGTLSVAAAPADGDGDGVPDAAEAVLGTDPQNPDTDGDGQNDLADAEPIMARTNPIATASVAKGIEIVSAKVEDNYDSVARRDAPDHLEFEVKNLTSSNVGDLEIYYTITDDKTGVMEAYYQKLEGLVLPKAASRLIHLDTVGAAGHFRANPNSALYRTPNGKTLSVQLAAQGYAPAQMQLHKDEGLEEAD
jgi:hypothetical protein